jgi:glycosyltransferase involved in cell wall biosynthesis
LGGGILGVVVALANATAARGVTTVVMYGRRPETPRNLEALFDPRVALLPVAGWGRRAPIASLASMLKAILSMRRELRRHPRGGILHLHSTYAGVAGRALPTPGWAVFYAPHAYVFLNPSKARSVRRIARTLEQALGRRGRTIACSETEGAVARGIVGAERVLVIRNGIDASDGEPRKPASDAAFVVASVGRAVFQRRPDLVAELSRELGRTMLEFRWIGDGPERPRLEAAGVHVTGWLDRDSAKAGLLDADVVLHLSAFEGLPLALLEAMATGRPVIASDLPITREVLGDSGLIVRTVGEAASAISRLRRDTELRELLGKAAAARVRTSFTAEAMIRKTLEAYETTLRAAGQQGDAETPRSA